jgi:dTDP-4-amino-4,6-dideoxygalactose transaminase
MGDLAAFSFYPGKNLGAYGEGGAVVTSNQQHAELMKRLRDHGQSEKYYHERIGYNYRMEAIQGAVLGVKLKHLDDWNRARRGLAHSYRLELKDAGVRLLDEQATLDSVHHVFPIFTGRRNELRQNLERLGINSGIHYPVPVHLQPGYKHLNYNAGDLPETERASQETLSLPMYPELTIASVNDVTGAIRQFCAESAAAHPSC